MVEIVLISPSLSDVYGFDIKKVSYGNPPMGIAYISSYLKKHNHSVKVIDLHFSKDPLKEVRNVIKKEKPKFVGISCMTASLEKCKKIAKEIKSIDGDILVVLGGPHPSALPKQVIKINDIDFVVYGEGEETMLDLLEKKDFNKIKGIVYKKGGKIIMNSPRKQINNLDILPFPDYEELKIKKNYCNYGEAFFPKRIGIIASRGCPYNCVFCAENTVYKGVRLRSVKNVIDEIEYLNNKYGIKRFAFYDNAFGFYKKRAIEICKEIIKRKLDIKWVLSSRVDNVDEQLLKIMKSSGCYYIMYGIESGSQKVLDTINKGISISQIEDTIRTTKNVGIKVYGAFTLGVPYENDSAIRETINFAKELPIDYATFNLLVPLPNTELFRLASKGEGIRFISNDSNKSKSIGYTNIELPNVTCERLVEYQKTAYKEFYIRPKFLLKKIFNDISFFIGNYKKLSSFMKLIKS